MASDPTTKKAVEDLFEEFWEWQMKDTPEYATLVGLKKHNADLDLVSPKSFEDRRDRCVDFSKKCDELLEKQMDKEQKQYLLLMKDQCDMFVAGYKYKAWVYCISCLEGPQVDLERLVEEWMPHETEEDFKNIIERFRVFPRQADETLQLLKVAISEGKTNNAISMQGVDKQSDRLLCSDVSESPLFAPFTKMPSSIPEPVQQALKEEAKAVLKEETMPALKKLQLFVCDEYMGFCRKGLGVNTLPDGEELYKLLLKFHTTTDLTPRQIHDLGLQEVKRIEEEMRKVIEETGSKDSIEEFTTKLKNDSRWYYNNPEDLMKGFKDLVYNEINPKLSQIILNVPSLPLDIKPLPASQQGGPGAFYLAGTFDGSRPGLFSVNTGLYNKQPKYEMMSLALHEGNPGHHLQCSATIENKSMPSFMRFNDDRRYFSSPSRFPFYTAYAEGWGLYSEHLGKDLNLYTCPYSRFGHLSMEMYRACRLVIDTGLHAFGWSFDEGVDFMQKHTAVNIQNIKNEVRRYITWPGQACGYKVGERMIMKMRENAEKSVNFDLRKFHDVILRNPGPLDMLEQQIKAEFMPVD